MDRPFAEVAAVLATYFDGLYHSDTKRLAEAFHPQARYVCAVDADDDEGLVCLGMDEYFPIVDARPSPASRNEPRRDRIVSVEFAGPASAFARVECAIGPKRFTDLLTLIRVAGRWRIVSKVFHYDLED